MIARTLRSLSNPEAETPPWGLFTAVGIPVFLLVALILGSVMILSLLGTSGFASLLGWIVGSAVAAAYIYATFRRDQAALRIVHTRHRL
jgi:hypothetical protein